LDSLNFGRFQNLGSEPPKRIWQFWLNIPGRSLELGEIRNSRENMLKEKSTERKFLI
jgi:hypothetical protein